MSTVVLARYLRDNRRSIAWWALGMVGLVAFTVAFYPSVKGNESFDKLFEDLPETVRALVGAQEGIPLTSPPGYLHGRLFSIMVPILLLTLGIGLGARAIGGSEADGTLDAAPANPVTRTRVVAERFAAMVVLLATVRHATVSLVALAPLVGLLDGVSITRLVAARAALCLALLHERWPSASGAPSAARSRPSPWPPRWRRPATSSRAWPRPAAGWEPSRHLALALVPRPQHRRRGAALPALAGPLLLTAVLFAAAVCLYNRRDLR